MQSFIYHTVSLIDFEAISVCLQSKNVVHKIFKKDNGDRTLYIYYPVIAPNGDKLEHYLRWVWRELDTESGNYPNIIKLQPDAKGQFIIDFFNYQLSSVVEILNVVLNCFGGYVHFGNVFYSIENLKELKIEFDGI